MPDTLSYRKIYGLLIPYLNSVVQPELDSLRPTGVSNQVARFTLDAQVLEELGDVAAKLVACGPEALLVGISTESFPGGLALAEQGIELLKERSGLPVFSAPHATLAALQALGARRLGVVTPFDDTANAHVRASFESAGFEVVAIAGLACPEISAIAHSKLAAIEQLFRDANVAAAEVLVQVGTGLPTLSLLDGIEAELGKPVVACNAALYWQALRETGIDDRIHGFGCLLAEH